MQDCGATYANCIVTVGGTISNRKGVNVPDVVLPVAALSDKDLKDLEFACTLGWIGWPCPLSSGPRMWNRRANWPRAARRSCPRSKSPPR